jgi:hypothetical protein
MLVRVSGPSRRESRRVFLTSSCLNRRQAVYLRDQLCTRGSLQSQLEDLQAQAIRQLSGQYPYFSLFRTGTSQSQFHSSNARITRIPSVIRMALASSAGCTSQRSAGVSRTHRTARVSTRSSTRKSRPAKRQRVKWAKPSCGSTTFPRTTMISTSSTGYVRFPGSFPKYYYSFADCSASYSDILQAAQPDRLRPGCPGLYGWKVNGKADRLPYTRPGHNGAIDFKCSDNSRFFVQ